MTVVNFSIPSTLEKRVEETMKQKGFASKAEFFRFAAIYFMDILGRRGENEDERFDYLTNVLQEELSMRYRGKTLPSAREQLVDV
jgi:metal-responsive CopG/Arc/MetJ family transcriptional regulator